ncbi:hypothetical protein halTADL_0676 [Halohasta litchfieldiae]|uniref:Uncharacterized protein n=1 Tax=Halohasta litchfieldiae TaxID=1073996 RepID=A0A1H6VAV1_9EURY|nr:hypothetical protein [Halohasta litchfieldiae]ATW87476.1 hypothetical protein halTADL_0676 [Halohasta litchfieldiae]SEJ00104.1 hypothetical protein SAMN05444271_11572 [Halohasta litchfieldiae]
MFFRLFYEVDGIIEAVHRRDLGLQLAGSVCASVVGISQHVSLGDRLDDQYPILWMPV